MKILDLMRGIPTTGLTGNGGTDVLGIAYSSKEVRPGFMFAALRGSRTDGMGFLQEALGNGAVAVLSEWPKPPNADVAWIQAADAREAMALASANFYGHPSEKLKVVGITGTKGKTTTAYILESIIKAAGSVPGVIGTVEYRWPNFRASAERTTPEAPDLQKMLYDMLQAGCTHGLLEVSSHALDQKRVWGVRFDVSVFTNLSGEHMDYHHSMDGYFEAKKKLFFLNHKKDASVVNMDDPWGKRLIAELPLRTITFGLEPAAIVQAEKFRMSENGLELQVKYPGGRITMSSKLVGKHNVYNILAATAAALALNIPVQAVIKGVSALRGVPGRFEIVENSFGLNIVVDYAHTDNALQNVLEAIRELKPRRIILVFGAGGNRDRGKRERMGEVAARLADWTIVTSDNPRDEDPLAIISDIEKGLRNKKSSTYEVIPDRREAIAKAIAVGKKGDYVLIAGKGHEDYQIIKDKKTRFSDVEELEALLRGLRAV